MKIRKLHIPESLVLAAFLGCSTGGVLVMDEAIQPSYASAQEIDEGYFYSNLAPHGEWFFQAEFGWVWHPTRVGVGWRPYTEGQWVWADDVGWVWASDEPWGWATYHYGRWYFDPYYGWTWVPGRVWAPAWVSWRVESSYIGWAPLWPIFFDLHPEYRWNNWHHDHDWDRRHHGRDWDRWIFTRDRDFTSERVGRHSIRDRQERDQIFERSRDVTRWDGDRPDQIGRSIDRSRIEKAVGRPIRSVRLEAADKPSERQTPREDRLQIFRPRVEERTDKTPDRLGLVKEPAKEPRDTLRQEKQRMERVAPKDRPAEGRAVRERENERGGAPAAIDRSEGLDRRGRGAAGERDREPGAAGREKEQGVDRTRPETAPDARERGPERGVDRTKPEKEPNVRERGPGARDLEPQREPEPAQDEPREMRTPGAQPRAPRDIDRQPQRAPAPQQRPEPRQQPRQEPRMERPSQPQQRPPAQQERMQRPPARQEQMQQRPPAPQQRPQPSRPQPAPVPKPRPKGGPGPQGDVPPPGGPPQEEPRGVERR